MKNLIAGTTALTLTMVMGGTSAWAEDISVSTTADIVSEYVFRGVSYQRGAVQTGAELGYGNWTLGAWSSLAMGETSSAAIDEIDVYGGYGFALSDTISGSTGFTIYHFPDTPGGLFDFGGASSFEVNAGLDFDTVLAPSIYAYYDLDLEAFTLEGGVSHSLELAEKTSLDLGLTAAFVTADGPGDYEYGLASAAITQDINDNVSAYVGANYSISSEDTLRFKVDGNGNGFTAKDNLLWVGAGIGTSF